MRDRRCRVWREDQIEALRVLARSGYSLPAIAVALNRPLTVVSAQARAMGIVLRSEW